MGQMIVRAIPDDLLAMFRERAKRQGTSAEALARRILIREAMLTPPVQKLTFDEALARSVELRALTPKGPLLDSTALIREFRDRGYQDDDN